MLTRHVNKQTDRQTLDRVIPVYTNTQRTKCVYVGGIIFTNKISCHKYLLWLSHQQMDRNIKHIYGLKSASSDTFPVDPSRKLHIKHM